MFAVIGFFIQQTRKSRHHKQLMLNKSPIVILLAVLLFSAGCNIVKTKSSTPILLKTSLASRDDLLGEVNRIAKVSSIRAKIDLKFEDNSFAQFGNKEVYRTAPGELVVQRPGKILLKIQIPVLNSDVTQMSSDGEKFRVAILRDENGGKDKKFVTGTNNADYSKLRSKLDTSDSAVGDKLKKSVKSFGNVRPQHFTDAMLVRPTDPQNAYLVSTIFQDELQDPEDKANTTRVMRGYYLLDEFQKNADGGLSVTRRFWFDRVGGIRLARQQIFDAQGEIDSDILYGQEGDLAGNPEYSRLPLRIQLTRPKDSYSIRITYQAPDQVTIGQTYPDKAFILQNTWNLPEVDLDQKLKEVSAQSPTDVSKITGRAQ